MRHRYPQSSHRLCSQCSQQYAQSPHIREPHSLHVRAQSSHTVLPHPHSTVSVPAQSSHSHPSQSRHRTAHSPDWRSQCLHRRSSPWWHGVSGHLLTLLCRLVFRTVRGGPDGRGAAQAAWPVGPVPGPPSAAAPAGRHADACDAPDVRSCCVPAGRTGSRLRWRDPFSTCSRRMAGRGGGSASPSGASSVFGGDPDPAGQGIPQNRYHLFPIVGNRGLEGS